MAHTKNSLIKIYGIAAVTSLILLAAVGFKQGASALFTVLVLAGLEITFSFDNAIINAKILQRMSRLWQTLFMTLGILVAVFVVRVFLPVVIVAVTTHEAFGHIVQLVLHDTHQYAHLLEGAQPLIATFGGLFLLMVFIDFMLSERNTKWIKNLETAAAGLSNIRFLSLAMGVGTLAITTLLLADAGEQHGVFIAGMVGLGLYVAMGLLNKIAAPKGKVSSAAQVGLVGFLYLELIDASFSLDGVIGAFAITKSVLLMGVGLGIGALFVRSMTVHLLRRGVLAKYIYLEHGAHYAIGLLGLLMLASVKIHVSEFVTGSAGLIIILIALAHSQHEIKAAK